MKLNTKSKSSIYDTPFVNIDSVVDEEITITVNEFMNLMMTTNC
jgi:hypothetical protein